MPNAVETIAGFYTAAGAGTGVATPAPGTTFTVPSFPTGSKAYLEQVYANGVSTDWVRIRSPRLHDPNIGIKMWAGGIKGTELLPWGNEEVLFPSDTPTVEIDETAIATGAILCQYGFDDLPGVQPRLASWAEVQGRIVHIAGMECDLVAGAIGAFGAGVALNTFADNFKAGDDYALLGYTTSALVTGIVINGPDTGGMNVGGPGINDAMRTSNYFIDWANSTGKPRIPIIAANNRGATLAMAVDVAAATAVKVSFILAQLA